MRDIFWGCPCGVKEDIDNALDFAYIALNMYTICIFEKKLNDNKYMLEPLKVI